jgi:MFS family permease
LTRLRLATADTFRSLRHRNFRLYFAAQAVSFTGTWLQLIAQSLLVLHLTGSGTALGLLTGVQFAPTLLLGAWAGVVIDRHDKRRLMQVTSTVMAVAALVLGVLVLTDRVTVAWVYVLAAVLGLANTFDNPARRSLVNDLVPRDEVANAVGLNSTLVTSARLVGPALAGGLVATVGIGWCFVVNGLTFVAPILAVRRMDASSLRTPPRVIRERGQLRAGLRYAWSVEEVRVPLLLMAVIGTLGFNSQVLLPLLATRELGGGDTTFTWLTTTGSLGMLVGSLWLARRRTIAVRLLAISATAFGLANVLLAAAPTVASALVASFLVGLTAIGILSGGNTVIQLAAEPAMRGRMLALFSVVFLGSTPIGGPIMGTIAEHLGTRAALGVGAAASVVAGLGALVALRLAAGRRPPVASPVALGADGTIAAA